jgi:hypothetical protein
VSIDGRCYGNRLCCSLLEQERSSIAPVLGFREVVGIKLQTESALQCGEQLLLEANLRNLKGSPRFGGEEHFALR